MRKIPHRVMAFFQDDSITLVGNNIDLKQISRYYPEMDSVIKNREVGEEYCQSGRLRSKETGCCL